MSDLLNVWTPGALLTAIIGGFLMGFVLISRLASDRYSPIAGAGLLAFVGIFGGLVFWSGQTVDTYYSGGEGLALRVIGRFFLWCAFVLMMAAGSGLGVRLRRGQ